ncbi:MAG TPA: FAD-dependent oxidoreductase, partial [Flavobacteriales bacterium]|nr:FAD-dependent oxidoreductase [Flavobacteriales bacterium]
MSTTELNTELLVLGAGPGGYSAAFRAADLGKKVVIVEKHEKLGGVCLNVGCIPSKALLHAARVIEDAKDMAAHGIEFGEPKIDTDKLLSWKEGTVNKLTDGLMGLAKRRKVEVVRGEGKFISPTELSVKMMDGNMNIKFENAIIAAG